MQAVDAAGELLAALQNQERAGITKSSAARMTWPFIVLEACLHYKDRFVIDCDLDILSTKDEEI